MNFCTISSQLILLSVSLTASQGHDEIICHLVEVCIPPAPIYANVQLWKNTQAGHSYYYFTKNDARIYRNFLLENVYSMMGRIVWLITNFDPSVIVTFETTEKAQQFYFGLNPIQPLHSNRFRVNEIRMIPPSPRSNTTIRQDIAVDIYPVKDARGQDSSTRRIIVHKTNHDQQPYCIFFANEHDLAIRRSDPTTLVFWVTPENQNAEWSCTVEIDFCDQASQRKFIKLYRRLPVPMKRRDMNYVRFMRSLRATNTWDPTPVSSSDENDAP